MRYVEGHEKIQGLNNALEVSPCGSRYRRSSYRPRQVDDRIVKISTEYMEANPKFESGAAAVNSHDAKYT
jgi:hypothetical protein